MPRPCRARPHRSERGCARLDGRSEAALKRAEKPGAQERSRSTSSILPPTFCSDAPTREGGLRARGRRAQARRSFNPSDPDSHAGLGDALLWSGEVEGRDQVARNRDAIDPRLSAEDLFSLGAAYFLVGRSADAVRTFERIITRKEGNPFIYAMLAAVYAENGRDDDSRPAAAEVRKLNPFFDVARFGSLFKKAEHRDRLANALKKNRVLMRTALLVS